MTVTMATMVTAMTMTRLNVCDASMEEKEHPSNPSQMHATIQIDKRARAKRIGRRWWGLRSVAPALARILRRRRETTRGRTMTTTDNTQQSNRIRWR